MHIFLQIFVREKTLKVPPTKPLVGGDGESRSNGGVGWGVGEKGEKGWVLTKCVEISRKPSVLSYSNIHKCFCHPCVGASFLREAP